MTLSARDRRILGEIARDLTAAEPRLARALAAARLPALRCWPLVAAKGTRGRPGIWMAVMLAPLPAGIALLTTGLILAIPVLIFAGALMTQFPPAVFGYLRARARRRRSAGR